MRDCSIELLRKSSSAPLAARPGVVNAKRIVVKQSHGDNLGQSTISASQRPSGTVQNKASTHKSTKTDFGLEGVNIPSSHRLFIFHLFFSLLSLTPSSWYTSPVIKKEKSCWVRIKNKIKEQEQEQEKFQKNKK